MADRVLLVDDEKNVLSAIRRELRGDFDLYTATSAPEALRRFLDGEIFAVLVTDIDMPGVSGLQLLDQVHQCAPRTCRVVLTGKPDVGAAYKLLSDHLVFRYVVKPCPALKLRNVIREAIAEYEHSILRNIRHGNTCTTTRSIRQAKVSHLKPGDELATNVTDSVGRVFVAGGTTIDEAIIKQLTKLASEGRIDSALAIFVGR